MARKSTPSLLFLFTTLGFIFGCIASFLFLQLQDLKLEQLLLELTPTLPSSSQYARTKAAPFSKHRLDDTLAKQGLSHEAFHMQTFKKRLASLVRATGIAAIVGVEWGAEATMLLNQGYSVHAFEPNPFYYDKLEKVVNRSRARGTDIHKRLKLYNVAGGDREGSFYLKYRGLEKRVPMEPVRKYIQTEIDLLSVDVQGAEPGVLRGAKGIAIRSLWVEVSCPTLDQVFELLGDDYVLFDFVPWGAPKHNKSAEVSINSYPEWLDRPSSYKDYKTWFCDVVHNKFIWLISDFVAIRRDVLTPQLANAMSTISHDLIVALTTK